MCVFFFFLMARRPPRSTQSRSSAASDVYKRQVYVNVEYGSCIPEIALEIQEKVKEAIENMTGYEVKFVDVHIQGVARRPKSELEESLEKMDAAHENFFGEE